MRRALALGALSLAVLSPACAGAERPEGIVERWILSLNQGAAGRPDRYAPEEVSAQVVPAWRGLEPGALDVVEVGADTAATTCEEPCAEIPFRVTDVDGEVTEGVALVEGDPDGTWRVTAVEMGASELPSDTGTWPSGGASARAWLVAIGLGVALALAAVAGVRLVRAPPYHED